MTTPPTTGSDPQAPPDPEVDQDLPPDVPPAESRGWFEAPDEPPARWMRVSPEDTPRRFTWRVITGLPRYTGPAALLTCVHQIGEVLVAVIVGQAVDRAIVPGDLRALVFWIALLAVNFTVLAWAVRFAARIGWLGMNRVQHDVRMVVTDHLLDARRPDGPGRLIGSHLSVATSDAYLLARSVGLAVYGPGSVAGVLACAVVLCSISWPLGLGVLGGAVLVLFLGDRLGGAIRRRVGAQQEAVADASGVAADLVDGLRVVKGVGAADVAARRYAQMSQSAMRARVAAARAEETGGAVLGLIGSAFVLAVGGAAALMAASGRLSVGQLITVVMVAQLVSAPVRALVHDLAFFWNPGVAAAGRLLEVLRETPAVADADTSAGPVPAGEVGVHVVAGGLEVSAAPGEHVVVLADPERVRPVLDVLTRARARQDGEAAHLVGVDPEARLDLHDLPVDVARRAVLVAPHESHLFAGSALHNIGLAAAPDALAPAIDAAACDQVAQMLPEGLDSPVGEGGVRLSGGQRQRVGLARALAADPPVLVLLDPTSAVDSVTEARIAQAVAQLRRGRTTIVVSSSPAWRAPTARVADLHATDHAAEHAVDHAVDHAAEAGEGR